MASVSETLRSPGRQPVIRTFVTFSSLQYPSQAFLP